MNICEKILASHANQSSVHSGDFLDCKIDLVMVHEQLGGRIAPEFEKLHRETIWDPSKVFYILDHWTPPPDVRAAQMHQTANQFASQYHFKWNFGMQNGICHQVLPEKGFAQPGHLIVGSDSHTTTYGAFNCFSTGIGATDVVLIFASGQLWFKVPETYRITFHGQLGSKSMGKDVILQILRDFHTDGANYESFEFGGSGLSALSLDARMSISNMIVETGAKAGIFEGDKILRAWLEKHLNSQYQSVISPFIEPDINTHYKKQINYELDSIPPLVAQPSRPDNVKPVEECAKIEIDQAFLGSCTNGRLEDLRVAAKICKNKHVPTRVKFIVIPASKEIYLAAMKEGLLEILINAGAMVEYPTCGPCIGAQMGLLGPNEIAISSSNRNFPGRMGHGSAKVYLSSPAVVAASAIAGYISIPDDPITEVRDYAK